MKEDEIVQESAEKKAEGETADGDATKKKTKTLSRKKTITDEKGNKKVIQLDAMVSEKLDEADEIDEKKEKEIEEEMAPLRAKSDFAKVMAFNSPKWIIFVACFFVGAAGVCQPLCGWVFAEFLEVLTIPKDIAA